MINSESSKFRYTAAAAVQNARVSRSASSFKIRRNHGRGPTVQVIERQTLACSMVSCLLPMFISSEESEGQRHGRRLDGLIDKRRQEGLESSSIDKVRWDHAGLVLERLL